MRINLKLAFLATAVIVMGCLTTLTLSPELRPYYFSTRHVQEGLDHISEEEIRTSIEFLASDSLEGRQSTYPGQKKAAEFIASYLDSFGLQTLPELSGYYQDIPMERVFLADSQHLRLFSGPDTLDLQFRKNLFIKPGDIFEGEEISAQIVFAGYGISSSRYNYDEYAPISTKNKWLMLIEGEPQMQDSLSRFNGREPTRWSRITVKQREAQQSGADGIIIIPTQLSKEPKSDFAEGIKSLKRNIERPIIQLRDTYRSNDIPVLYLSSSLADSLLSPSGKSIKQYQQIIDSTLKPVSFPLACSLKAHIDVRKDSVNTENLLAMVPGQSEILEKNYVVISAHYDHVGSLGDSVIYNGADDNASGTAGVLSIAKALALNPVKPARSVIFALFSAEEVGLIGSEYFTDHSPVELDSITANINLDMIGRNSTDSIYVIGSDMLSIDLHKLSKIAEHHVSNLHYNYKYNDRDEPRRLYYRSDHYSFAKYNIPAIFFFSGLHEDYHKPTDTADKIDYRKVTKVTKAAFITAWGVANYHTQLKQDGKLFAREY